jgi:5'-3' exonuclease
MTITSLWDVVDSKGIVQKRVPLSSLSGMVVGVDMSVEIVSALNLHGGTRPYLRAIFFRFSRLLRFGIDIVGIFDGKPPHLKQRRNIAVAGQSRRQRQRHRQRESHSHSHSHSQSSMAPGPVAVAAAAAAATTTTTTTGTTGTPIPLAADHHTVNAQRNGLFQSYCNIVKELLNLMGIRILELEHGEAEANAAILTSLHIDAVLTSDSDALAFGATKIIRNLITDKRNVCCDIIDMKDIRYRLGWGSSRILAFAMLLGNDYFPNGVHRVGVKTAVQFLNDPSFDTLSVSNAQRDRWPLDLIRAAVLHGHHEHEHEHDAHARDTLPIDATFVDHVCPELKSGVSRKTIVKVLRHVHQCDRRQLLYALDLFLDPVTDDLVTTIRNMYERDQNAVRLFYRTKRPAIQELQQFLVDKLRWTKIRAAQHCRFPTMAWEMREYAELDTPFSTWEPIKIVKQRTVSEKPVYELQWKALIDVPLSHSQSSVDDEKDDNTMSQSSHDEPLQSQSQSQSQSQFLVTEEPAEILELYLPVLVQTFKQEQAALAAAKKHKSKKVAANVGNLDKHKHKFKSSSLLASFRATKKRTTATRRNVVKPKQSQSQSQSQHDDHDGKGSLFVTPLKSKPVGSSSMISVPLVPPTGHSLSDLTTRFATTKQSSSESHGDSNSNSNCYCSSSSSSSKRHSCQVNQSTEHDASHRVEISLITPESTHVVCKRRKVEASLSESVLGPDVGVGVGGSGGIAVVDLCDSPLSDSTGPGERLTVSGNTNSQNVAMMVDLSSP